MSNNRIRKGESSIRSSRFHIIHTNDLHSHFQYWPKTVTTIKTLKKQLDSIEEPYLLLDIGDHMDRSHLITEGSVGQANIEMMNQVGYDYVTIGNNEGITFSKQQLNDLYEHATFKVIVNNLFENGNHYPQWASPYQIHMCGESKVGLIGSTINFSPFYELLGWHSKDPIECIRESVSLLRDQVDVMILMSHLGLPRDKKVADEIKGIDVIVGAHTHQLLQDGLKVGQSWINQAGKFGEYVGQVTIEFSNKGRVTCSSTCLPVKDTYPDLKADKLIHDWNAKAEQELSKQIAMLPEQIDIDWYEESIFSNLMAEGLKDWCQTSLSVVNAGQILNQLPIGKVTKRDIHQICPHPINPCIIRLTGTEIWSILQRSLEAELQQTKIKGFGFRGKVLGMLAIDGVEVYYHSQKDGSKKISHIQIGKNTLQLEAEYEVATIDMFTFSHIFPEFHKPLQTRYCLPEFLRDILAHRFEQGDIERAKKKRWIQT